MSLVLREQRQLLNTVGHRLLKRTIGVRSRSTTDSRIRLVSTPVPVPQYSLLSFTGLQHSEYNQQDASELRPQTQSVYGACP